MIYKFAHIHKIRTVNGEFITDEFMKQHNEIWSKHKPLDVDHLHLNLEQQFWEGTLADDVHEIRDNLEEIKFQRKVQKMEKQVIDGNIINDEYEYSP